MGWFCAVTKINHNRPTLRLLDNYRRELRSQAHEYSVSEAASEIAVSGKIKRMPGVSQSAQQLIISMFDAADLYFVVFLRIPLKPAMDSETKPATRSDFIPASVPI